MKTHTLIKPVRKYKKVGGHKWRIYKRLIPICTYPFMRKRGFAFVKIYSKFIDGRYIIIRATRMAEVSATFG